MNGPGSYSGSQETAAIQGTKNDYVSKPVSSYDSYKNMQNAKVVYPNTNPVQANVAAYTAPTDTSNYGESGGNNATPTPTPIVSNAPTPIPTPPATILNGPSIPVATSGGQISMNVDGLYECKDLLEAAVCEIQIAMQNIMTENTKIEESWAGPDAAVYIEKIGKMKPKVDAAMKALKATYETYQKAIDEIQNTQNSIKQQI